MKPITWLRKFAGRGFQGYPVATLAFYGPDDHKASKAVLGIIEPEGAEPRLHKWFSDTRDKDLRYDVSLQNAWIGIIRRESAQTLAMAEEINSCPHEEGIDYPAGQSCPDCPFWAEHTRPLDRPAEVISAIAVYDSDQWEALLASAADRAKLEDTWEEWNAGVEKLIAELERLGLPYIRIPLDVNEIVQYCEEHGIPNDGQARSQLAASKAQGGATL